MKRFSPQAELDKHTLLEVLRGVLPPRGLVLEIASGTGQHIAHFATALPELCWQPTEPSPIGLDSIASWTAGLANVQAPLALEVGATSWSIAAADAILVINLLHLVPPPIARALFEGARRVLPVGGPLCIVGAVRTSDTALAPAIPPHLSAWTVRITPPTLEAMIEDATASGFALDMQQELAQLQEQLLVFRRA